MNYWRVNHKQTHTEEIQGGYNWSPKTNQGGSRNQTYINLTKTKPGDIIYSYANGKLMAIGTVTKSCISSTKPAVNQLWPSKQQTT